MTGRGRAASDPKWMVSGTRYAAETRQHSLRSYNTFVGTT